MVSITRTLTLKEYGTANGLALRNGTARQRRNYFFCVKFGPYIGGLFLLLSILFGVSSWRAGRADWSPVVLLISGVVLCAQPVMLRLKIKKLFVAQQLDRPWMLEADEDGVHSVVPGLADSRLTWQYFTTFVETDDLFLLINSRRPAFVSFPKRELDAGMLEELRGLARGNIAVDKPR
jgi:YcxB-like protein